MAPKKKKKVKFKVKLKELRKELGLNQKDIKKFKQASVSKIESRKDLKLSTLVKYLGALGLDVTVTATEKEGTEGKIPREFTLISTGGDDDSDDEEKAEETKKSKEKAEKKAVAETQSKVNQEPEG